MNTKALILAIGGAGIKIASRLKQQGLLPNQVLGVDLATQPTSFDILSIGNSGLELLGSGGDPEVASRAFESRKVLMEEKLASHDWVIIVAGLGGGTASALAPLVADCAAKSGALVMAFVTLPFSIEGSRRANQAKDALDKLRKTTPSVITLSNDQLLNPSAEGTGAEHSFQQTDRIIARAIASLNDLAGCGGLLEVDYTSFKKLFSSKENHKMLFALGRAEGPNAPAEALADLMRSPLFGSGYLARSADHLALCVKISPEFGLGEINDLANNLTQRLGARGERLISAVVEPTWKETVELAAVGLLAPPMPKKKAAPPAQISPADKASRKASAKAPSPQTELPFENLTLEKGFFEACEPNLYRGEDIDQPTYLRRGIKLLS